MESPWRVGTTSYNNIQIFSSIKENLIVFFSNKQTNKQAMPIEQYTYWSMTINNPDENDYVLVRNPNDKYIRQLVWTPEEGEKEGTPHIQAWIRLQRNQTFSFMKKLFPRGSFKHCEKDEYNENVHQYAQKNDNTTRGAHVITLNDPLLTIETMMKKVIVKMIEEQDEADDIIDDLELHRRLVQKSLVREDYRNAKFFVSAVYKQMWKEYGHEMYENIFSAMKHNKHAKDGVGSNGEAPDLQEGCSEGDQDSASCEDERSVESGSSSGSSSHDSEESGEQSDWE